MCSPLHIYMLFHFIFYFSFRFDAALLSASFPLRVCMCALLSMRRDNVPATQTEMPNRIHFDFCFTFLVASVHCQSVCGCTMLSDRLYKLYIIRISSLLFSLAQWLEAGKISRIKQILSVKGKWKRGLYYRKHRPFMSTRIITLNHNFLLRNERVWLLSYANIILFVNLF